MIDPRAVLAARNNADWCDIVCRTHGIPTRFDDDAWTTTRRSPPMYPDAVTLQAAPDRLLDRIDTSAGCSVKDSFASLDLTAAGMRVLFEADWLYHPGTPPGHTGQLAWSTVRTPEQLRAWAAAHGGGDVFRPALLAEPDVTVLSAGESACGAIVNRNNRNNRNTGTVGVSNVFTTIPLQDAWRELVGAIASRFPGLPVVGYEHGESLAAASAAGFVPVGGLRVWLHE